MTVRLVTGVHTYNGLSTDDLPSSPPEGSTFHAVDTGEQFIFHNDGWETDNRLIYALRNLI